jgi:hypothetical protein
MLVGGKFGSGKLETVGARFTAVYLKKKKTDSNNVDLNFCP